MCNFDFQNETILEATILAYKQLFPQIFSLICSIGTASCALKIISKITKNL